jgi:hypothetical protein
MRNQYAVFTRLSRQIIVFLIVIVGCAFLTPSIFAQEGEMSADEAAKKLANPAGSLANLANNLTYRSFTGDLPDAGSQYSLAYTFQPVLPFPVGDKGRNIIFRPAFTLVFGQPVYNSSEDSFESLGANLNDITFDAVYAGTEMKGSGNGFLWGYGLAGTIPIATHDALGGSQWRFGPELFGGVIRHWGVVGALINNQWNFGGGGGEPGSNDVPYNSMTAQYFYGITLGQGWQILSAPVVSYNWKAESNEALSLPLGTGIAKTLKIGRITWRFQTEVYYYVVQPDSFGSEWMLSLDIRPVIRNPLVRK